MGNKLEYLVYIAGKIYLRYLEKKLSIQRTRYTIITPAMTILIIRTNIIYRIKDLFLWNNISAKLLQKSEMRKDIVIELSYKGFG